VNETTGNVYVVDKGNNRVEEFTPAGVYVAQFDGSGTHPNEGSAAPAGRFSAPEGIAVDNSTNPLDPSAGDVYVVDSGYSVIDKFTSSGGYVGQVTEGSPGSHFFRLWGVAVDQNGTLYVFGELPFKGIASYSDAVVNEFLSERGPQVGGESRFAVDSEDNFYVGFSGVGSTSVISKLSSTGTLEEIEVDPGELSTAVAVNLSNNDAYIDNANSVGVFSSTGKLMERFGSENLRAGTGLAVDSTGGLVFVADSATDTLNVFELEPVSPPVVGGEWASNVASTSATLDAQMYPHGFATEYRFEYGPTSSYGTSAPISGGAVAAGFGASDVNVHVQELSPHTTYHYRLVAHNELGTVEGPDHSFTTQTAGVALTLPDGRAWELVTPANKKGALVEPFTSVADVPMIQAAADGSGIAYYTTGPNIGEHPQANIVTSPALSRRSSGGWRTEDLTVPVSLGYIAEKAPASLTVSPEYFFFSSDLLSAVAEPHDFGVPPLSPEATERTPYIRNDLTGAFAPLVTPADVPPGTHFGGETKGLDPHVQEYLMIRVLWATPDLHHVVFGSPLALTPGAIANASGGEWNMYEWNEGEGLQLINFLPGGEQAVPSSGFDGMFLAGHSHIEISPVGSAGARATSDDGRWVAWTWGEPYNAAEDYRGLYVRDTVAGKSYRVGGPHALYQTMSADGSRIFYLEGGSLYVFEPLAAPGGVTTDLTETLLGSGEHNASVQENVIGTSEDGSYIYFVATGVLANGATSGEYNLYVAHDGAGGWSIGYVATLAHEDVPDWWAQYFGVIPTLEKVTSRVSPDGRYLAFMSERSLTGYDNIDAVSGMPDVEVYLYNAATEGGKSKLACGACDPTGARPVGVFDSWGSKGEFELPLVDRADGGSWDARKLRSHTELAHPHWLAGSLPPWYGTGAPSHQPRYLSDSGRVFFNSPDALVPQDSNGLEDVNEYEPAGVGSCTTGSVTFNASSGGCVGLISSGTSSEESDLFDASETGDDVFFITTSKLVGADYDTSFDIYDAHVCSSSVPCVSEPAVPPPCTSGDSCKAAPSPQPEIFGPAPSATFSGHGNVVEETPSKPVVRARSLSRAQKLAIALRACQRKRGKRRASCERQAHERYAVKRSRKASTSRKGQG
jgi:DNA-binding beta-propeller fold protein YncE